MRAVLPTVAELPFAPKRRAALPARKGVAILVPDSTAHDPSGTGKVDSIFPPGAAMAGLKKKSSVGPYELNEEMRPPDGSGRS